MRARRCLVFVQPRTFFRISEASSASTPEVASLQAYNTDRLPDEAVNPPGNAGLFLWKLSFGPILMANAGKVSGTAKNALGQFLLQAGIWVGKMSIVGRADRAGTVGIP